LNFHSQRNHIQTYRLDVLQKYGHALLRVSFILHSEYESQDMHKRRSFFL